MTCERCEEVTHTRRTRCSDCSRLVCGRCCRHWRPVNQRRGGPCKATCWDCQAAEESKKPPVKQTWKEAKGKGIQRCCASLYNNRTKKSRRCRHRAIENEDGTWGSYCVKHKWVSQAITDMNQRAINALRQDGQS